jgi:DNA helicase IV
VEAESRFNNARLQERKDQRSSNKGRDIMKTIQHTPEQHNIMEVMSESVMATLIIGLSVAATLVAIMMVVGA